MQMRMRIVLFGLLGVLAHAATVAAQGTAGSAAELQAPVLETRAEAEYPPAALERRAEADVGLELTIDASGVVTSVRVTAPAGSGFDEAASAAATKFRFSPARRAGVPIESIVQFTYSFRPPPAPATTGEADSVTREAQPALAAARPPADDAIQTGADQATLVLASRPISAASAFSVRDRDFALRPIGSVQDILRVTPGLVLVQHSGGGKANQYFIRGFDADHGTDLALSIDGVPINMVSHAHGQGFSDTNFIIPEVVERVEVTKGPYFANQGDFATAGAVNLIARDGFESSSAAFGLTTTPGHGGAGYRALLIASPQLDAVKATLAAEISRSDGPFDRAEGWDKYKLFNKLAFQINPSSSLSLTQMSYASNWHGSGQVPNRAVDRGLISRFGSIDPDEGGNTARHQFALQYKLRPNEQSEFKALAYIGWYRFNLFSNFTLYLDDPVHGDEIEQVDRRLFMGGRVSYRVMQDVGGVRFDTTLGADGRSDDIHAELWHTAARARLDARRNADVHESFGGLFLNEEISPARWLRLVLGGRVDTLSFAVDDQLRSMDADAPRSGVDGAHQLSPKASLIVTPLEHPQAQVDVYANYGHGFHSNDVRGAFASPAVSPLTRAIGAEVGSRARLLGRWDLAVSFWQLDLDAETVWSGDEGTTEVGGATKRSGIELETRYEFTPWLAADLDVTFSRSRFKANAGNGNGLALAPKQTFSGGVSGRHALGPGVARGGLRFFGIGDRPASDDGEIEAPGFGQLDLHLGYRISRFDLSLDIENLLDGHFRAAQFDTVSRLQGEPAIGAPVPAGFGCGRNARLARAPNGDPANATFNGCEEVDYTPAYPRTLRILASVFLD